MAKPPSLQTADRKHRLFQPGISGNPAGRKKGVQNKATQSVKQLAQGLVDDPIYRANLKTRLQTGALAPALESLIWHYAYGKPKETVDLTVAPSVRLDGLTEAEIDEGVQAYEVLSQLKAKHAEAEA